MTSVPPRGCEVGKPGKLYTGTSGFAFKEWKGVFYPQGLPDKQMLAYYSTRLRSVEINYTFRRMPSESTLQSWKEQAGEGFRFTLKAPQSITHLKRLAGVEQAVDEFARRARILGDSLGMILFQLPPNLRFEQELLEGFLNILPPVAPYAMEFRHDSWSSDRATQLLSFHRIARCGADTDQSPLKGPPVTAPHVYLRLRKQEYAEPDLVGWGSKVARLVHDGHDVYCYFKHEGGGAGPSYAAALEKAAAA